jgi:hypothetical protein
LEEDNVKKKIAVLAGICMLVSVQGTVFAADKNSPDDLSDQTVQSVIRADVPDSHKITVKGEHVTVSLEGGNQEENSILVERFSEPKLKFSPEKGWKMKKVLLGDTDVTSQVKDGIITLASVYEDLILTVETERIKDESGTKTDSKSNTKPNTSSSQKTNQNSKNNQTSTTNGTKTTANSGSATTVGQGIKAAVTEDEMNVGIYGIGVIAAGGMAVWCLKRKKEKI